MTDRRTHGRTDARGKTICLPTLSGGDIMTFVTSVAFHTIYEYPIFEQKNGCETHLIFKDVIRDSHLEHCPFQQRMKITTLPVNMWIISI